MKKYLSIIIVGILTVSILTGFAIGMQSSIKTTETLDFSSPTIKESQNEATITLHIEGSNTVLQKPNRPILPAYTKTYVFPLGTTIQKIEFHTISPVRKRTLQNDLELATEPVHPGIMQTTSNSAKRGYEESTYHSESYFPEQWFTYQKGCGLHNDERVLILTVNVYPVRYAHSDHSVQYITKGRIEITSKPPSESVVNKDEYDLLIIAPSQFTSSLQDLVDHKENHGIETILVTLDEILQGNYFAVQGRDDAEKMKYFIKNAVEEWGIRYVLLVGGRKPGVSEQWYVPVRYVHVYWEQERRYVSDLYFADIYDANQDFATWDTDDNNVFGEWLNMKELQDDMDLYPDVYVGRWACKNEYEVNIMVEKTLQYENHVASKKIVLAGGDNFPEGDEIEGEVVGDKTLTYLPDFEAEKVYSSEMDVTARAIKQALGDGALFMHLHGHGSPIYWSTHKPNGFDQWEQGLGIWNLPLFFNEEYPIVVVGGCHTAMFNVSLTIHPWTGGIPAPEGISWWFARKIQGGAIASLGYTCFPVASPGENGDLDGDGVNEPDCVESGYGYMQLKLFEAYGIENKSFLGECWGSAIYDYTSQFKYPYERYHLHTIHGFVLLGDPSLKIGGYSS